ncbi:hypothetical protein D3C79_520740 [compost metagenome]
MAEQPLQGAVAQALQRILLLPPLMANQHHHVRQGRILCRREADAGGGKVHIEQPRHIAIFTLQLQTIELVTRHRGLIAKAAGADDAVLPVPAIANAIDVDPVE